MNPTNFGCPSDISMLSTTDYRPNKTLYANIQNNNKFRMYLQKNAGLIRQMYLAKYVREMKCGCEVNPTHIPMFDNTKIMLKTTKPRGLPQYPSLFLFNNRDGG